MPRLDGKVALITGGAAGIGRATAMAFAREGARIAVIDRDAQQGRETAQRIEAAGARALFIEADVTDAEQVAAAVGEVVRAFGGLHILHNNAGGSSARDAAVTEAPEDEFWARIRIDLYGTWLCCRHGIPEIVRSGGGSVINMSSIFAFLGTHGKDAYTAAKGAVSALTRSMAVEFAKDRVRVNAIAPGATLTDRVVAMMKVDGVTSISARNQLFGMIAPEDVASTALFLASDESRSTTGHILPVDGGLIIS
ncbi:Short-chain dehydrogenase/reductase SDR [Caballeronia hypogeia]|uniref:Short-chain dehydrogenase/reductase SDR n=1 Tax=Caballeronia hypogeia TaxID=1777140 RepID=A0A158A7A3_9BURK|nr:SDR family oxidoreductase [Caballeronia hypogeia]SAK53650.1 Short-chain dehydrogenase/reductase SDR [Caballeronia hypogeia]